VTEPLTVPMPYSCPQLASRPVWLWHGPCHQGHMNCVKAARRHEAAQRARRRSATLGRIAAAKEAGDA
jgi:hypothetical protein